MGDYVNEEHVMTIGDVLSVTGGSTTPAFSLRQYRLGIKTTEFQD